ncbi:MAG: DNA-3-methyladenine glycosylase [Candidatus Nanohaloarchaea archaeon]
MESFEIPASDFDLELTMTCGQTFCWHRVDGELYGEGSSRFYTFRDGKPLIVEQEGDSLFVETELSSREVKEALGLHHDLDEIFSSFPRDPRVEKAKQELHGLRVVSDEFFPTLVSYLLSPQMRIPRIKKMYDDIAREYGETLEVDGDELLRFPTADELSRATEQELRDLGVGYRAPYIERSTEIFLDGFDPGEVKEMRYEEAREEMKQFHGVGNKVADCVLLFSLGFTEAYPLDTWALKAVEKHYPELYAGDYAKTSRRLREHFGEHAGYAQEYIFHATRSGVIKV